MGGKNAIIVDSDADLDDVVPALLKSAFAFAGQKCSAASRALVHAAVADELAERMAGAVTTLRVGPAADFGTDVPPVIDVAAQQKIQRYIAVATPLAQAETRDDGFYVAPTIFAGLPADHAVITEEIFGPVLSPRDRPEHRARLRRRRRARASPSPAASSAAARARSST